MYLCTALYIQEKHLKNKPKTTIKDHLWRERKNRGQGARYL